jgi:hypothetical protein
MRLPPPVSLLIPIPENANVHLQRLVTGGIVDDVESPKFVLSIHWIRGLEQHNTATANFFSHEMIGKHPLSSSMYPIVSGIVKSKDL